MILLFYDRLIVLQMHTLSYSVHSKVNLFDKIECQLEEKESLKLFHTASSFSHRHQGDWIYSDDWREILTLKVLVTTIDALGHL